MGNCCSPKRRVRAVPLGIPYLKISEYYTVGKVLGTGHFGIVRKGYMNNNPSKFFAIKSIDKNRMRSPQELNKLKREVEILQEVDHPNIIKLYESY